MIDNIEKAMADELSKAHVITQDLIAKASAAVKAATGSAAYAGQLVEKASRSKKTTVYQWLSECAQIDGETARAYKLAHTTAQTRKAHSDRRCLLRLGVLEGQVKTQAKPSKVKTPLSLSSIVRRATASVAKGLENRPISAMSGAEKHLLKGQLEDLARVYVELSRPAQSSQGQ
ncbi:hypothetical protein JO972_01910 [Verrucomicrobiaceae bacterium 5K15]|uniref:Uncharacterized protein n=1 Tax=Oceaniferula flava TaxID=2800421 RepID=A0AAE2SCE9_9BACT|nr:hypothetical protein [Oceaniferula flavus]MBK1853701.1 hypothetical protein [Oceaniferula flavus]MBM1135007.1 hypothetical protein [Oceaniferula flavus]